MHAGEADEAQEQVRFTEDFAADCYRFQAKMRRIENTDSERAIKVYLERYLGDTRQPGRSSLTLEPASGPVALGCTRASGHAQRWEIVRAAFVE